MGTLKGFFSPSLVRRLAGDLARVYPAFDGPAFVAEASRGLGGLELLDRGRHIARTMARHLPQSYPEAIAVLLASLGPEHECDELLGVGMGPFFYYPHTLFVAEHGLQHFDLSMRAQVELTKRFSAEGSIRPYIAAEPERTFALMRTWTTDANPHVRRLVSEGTRLRLPWAARVPWLDQHPERVLALLELLKDDSSTMVRRSVANNLNDLGKHHPDLLLSTCTRWLRGASAERRALVEHALRTAVKRGEPGALHLLGFGGAARIAVEDVRFTPARVAIGGRVRFAFSLRSRARTPQELLVDVALHFVKARGETSAKVFKVKRVTLPPGAEVALGVTFSLAVHTTRVPRPGKHAVDIIVNGQTFPAGAFHVTGPPPARPNASLRRSVQVSHGPKRAE